jgi:hypothetical protein
MRFENCAIPQTLVPNDLTPPSPPVNTTLRLCLNHVCRPPKNAMHLGRSNVCRSFGIVIGMIRNCEDADPRWRPKTERKYVAGLRNA